MRPTAIALAAALATIFACQSATAQTLPSRVAPFPVDKSASSRPKTVQISVSYQFFIDTKTGDMEEQAKLSDDGRKQLYRMFARECEVLMDTIADECYVNRANVSSQVRNFNRRREGIRVSGSATYQITLKPTKRRSDEATKKP